MNCMRPVPVVLLLFAFWPHSYPLVLAAGYAQDEQVDFCLWKEIFPQRLHAVWVLVCLLPKDVVPFVIFASGWVD
eukprot:CAMPEP_0173176948 /NCGR_PEP_ID=MMETSP1141-20130122/4733_1 /TAXON_ID=483371 /ORGANISM="non described non described, Strain CCMP2298" /LENGTH=74 /DNA_ID=CAMNT_0014099323 /DNA_START=140 /DNA_END=364 /DNA_ORIENTATION=+